MAESITAKSILSGILFYREYVLITARYVKAKNPLKMDDTEGIGTEKLGLMFEDAQSKMAVAHMAEERKYSWII